MPEVPLSPEAAEMLPKAVKEVALLYLGDQRGGGFQKPQEGDESWRRGASKFPPFSTHIAGLREALKKADAIKEGYTDWKNSIGGALTSEDIANTIVFAYQQPQRLCIREIVLCPTLQAP